MNTYKVKGKGGRIGGWQIRPKTINTYKQHKNIDHKQRHWHSQHNIQPWTQLEGYKLNSIKTKKNTNMFKRGVIFIRAEKGINKKREAWAQAWGGGEIK